MLWRGLYEQVTVYPEPYKMQPRYVHHLVLLAFVGPRPEGLITRHLNGDSLDNRLSNLKYGTHAENSADMVRHGRSNNANKTHCPQDHEYTEANTKLYQGRRYCRACNREDSRRRRARQ